MKVVILARSITAHRFGGVETHGATLARGAARLGHDVVVVTTSHPSGVRQEIRDGVRYVYLPETPPTLYTPAWQSASVRTVRELASTEGIDLVLSLGVSGHALAAARLGIAHHAVACGESLPHVVSEWHQAEGLGGMLRYPKHGLAALYFAWLEHRLWSRADGVIATDGRVYRRLARRGYRVRLSYVGIELPAFVDDGAGRKEARRRLGIPDDARVLLTVGTVNRQKGTWLGAEVFRGLAERDRGLHLMVVGDGPDLPALRERLARQLADGRVHLPGAVPLDDVPPYYLASDVFVYPTLRVEGLPIALMEACAAGLPIVAAARGGIPFTFTHGETALLVRPGDRAALEAALRRILDDPTVAVALGRHARELAHARFDARVETARLFEDLRPRSRR